MARYEWDFAGDGFTDATTAQVARASTSAGEKTVRLVVYDDSGTPSIPMTATFTFSPPSANRLPVVQFSISDLDPKVGQQVSLRSFSL